MIPQVITPILIENGLDEDSIGWKKAMYFDVAKGSYRRVIVKLTIPKDALLVLGRNKCRASYAKVEGIYPSSRYHKEPPAVLPITEAESWYTFPFGKFVYKVGQYVYPDLFSMGAEVCAHGIHFFRTYSEAARYNFS